WHSGVVAMPDTRVVLWAAAAIAACAAAAVAISASDVARTPPLNGDDIARALASSPGVVGAPALGDGPPGPTPAASRGGAPVGTARGLGGATTAPAGNPVTAPTGGVEPAPVSAPAPVTPGPT